MSRLQRLLKKLVMTKLVMMKQKKHKPQSKHCKLVGKGPSGPFFYAWFLDLLTRQSAHMLATG